MSALGMGSVRDRISGTGWSRQGSSTPPIPSRTRMVSVAGNPFSDAPAMAAAMNNADPVLEPGEAMDVDPKADGYFRQTQRPLVCLAFLLPWVLF